MFTVSVLKEIYDSGKPLLFSPYGLHKTLSEGCKDVTKIQLDELLDTELYDYKNNYFQNEALKEVSVLAIKNTYKVNHDFRSKIYKLYKTKIIKYYSIRQIPKLINHWMKNNTDNMVTDVSCYVHENTKLIAANAVCLSTDCKSIFGNIGYSDVKFCRYDGSFTSVEAIVLEPGYYLYSYLCDINSRVIRIWRQGCEFIISLIVPDDIKGLDMLVDTMTRDTLHEITTRKMEYVFLQPWIPKFSLTHNQNFIMPVFNLGCYNLFVDGDLSGISNYRDLQISGIIQKSTIHLNYYEPYMKTLSEKNNNSLVLNRPFMFIITNSNSDIPLLLGIYQSP